MSDWDAKTKLVDRKTTATEGGTHVAEGPSVPAVIEQLKVLCAQRGVGGVFAVNNVEDYEVTITATITARAADVAPQVFIAGLADTANLGIYVLDPGNRWTPGDLAEQSAWRARAGLLIELINVNTGATVNDSYITFDPLTCRLTYTGKDPGSPRLYDLQFRIDGVAWPAFKLRIQRPTFSFGDQSYETLTGIAGIPHVLPQNFGLGAAIAARFDPSSADNLVLLTPSTATADRYYVATVTKFKDGLASCYVLGVPGGTAIGKPNEKFTTIGIKRAGIAYWKDLVIDSAIKFATEDCVLHVLDQISMTRVNASDGVTMDNTTPWLPANTAQSAWVVNSAFTRCGQSGNKHPMYIHLRDDPQGSRSGGDATVHFNNVRSFGNNSAPMVNGVGPQGGCNIKCLSKRMTVRNCYLPLTDNPADPRNSYVSSQVTSFHAHQRIVGYNNVFSAFNTAIQNFGQDKLVVLQNRNIADSGHDDPKYFNEDPGLPAIPPYQPSSVVFTADPASNFLNWPTKFPINRAVTLKSTGTLPKPLNSTTTYYLMDQTLVHTRLSLTATGQQPIDITDAGTGVHTMTGVPTTLTFNADYHGSNTYVNPAVNAPFWGLVTAKPISDPTNTYAYHKFWSYNFFEFVQLAGSDNQLVCAALYDEGNAPRGPTRQFQPEQNYFSVPLNFAERSQNFIANNTYKGFKNAGSKVVRWNGSTPPAMGYKYPYCVDPLKPRPDPIEVGGERDYGDAVADVPLPDWFPI